MDIVSAHSSNIDVGVASAFRALPKASDVLHDTCQDK